jgi:hypothetical protein
MNRRGFLSGGLILIAAPAIVRASSLMPIHDPIVNGIEFIGKEDNKFYNKRVWYSPYNFKYYKPPNVWEHFCYFNPKHITPAKLSKFSDVIKFQTSEKIGYTRWREL